MDRVTQNLVTDFLKNYELKSKDDSFDFERFANYSVIKNIFNNDFQIEEISTGKNQGIDGWVRCTLAGNIPYYSRWIHPLLLDGFDTLDSAIAKLDLFMTPVKFYHYNGTIIKDENLKVMGEGKQSKGGLNPAPTTDRPSTPKPQKPKTSRNRYLGLGAPPNPNPDWSELIAPDKEGIFYTASSKNERLEPDGDSHFYSKDDAGQYLIDNGYEFNDITDLFEKFDDDGGIIDIAHVAVNVLK